jgi:8-oxo-dGTP diphosphatase
MTSTAKQYVAGFAVNRETSRIALVRKSHPKWQAGRLNGIGGKIEDGEDPLGAMQREFQEETGIYVRDWRHFVSLGGIGWIVHFFVAFVTEEELWSMHGDEEPIEIHGLESIHLLSVIQNLRWLIPLALDQDLIEGTLRDTVGWVAPEED